MGGSDMDEREKMLEVLSEIREDVDFANETELVEGGILDSIDLTQIIAALDETFDVHITTGDIEPENFNSVDAMLDLVHSYHMER